MHLLENGGLGGFHCTAEARQTACELLQQRCPPVYLKQHGIRQDSAFGSVHAAVERCEGTISACSTAADAAAMPC